jgi:hypothetical protein
MISIEYLIEQLSDKLSKEEKEWYINTAREMHRKEIEKAFEDGRSTGQYDFQWADGKFYYDELFSMED